MDFTKAVKTVYQTIGNDDELNNAFYVYSCISDLVGNSYIDKKLVATFFKAAKVLPLFSMQARGERIEKFYDRLGNDVDKQSFLEVCKTIGSVVKPQKGRKRGRPRAHSDQTAEEMLSVNVSLDQLSEEEDFELQDETMDVEETVERRIMAETLHAVVDALAKEDRTICNYVMEGKTELEIAQLMNVPRMTRAHRMKRLMVSLKQKLGLG